MAMISYAQNREDVLLARVFPGKTGFYVDVGAAHPVAHSVTKWFYDQGWSGVNVEPLPHFFSLMVQNRPRDINLNLAVSDQTGECILHEVTNCIGTSTVCPIMADQIARSGAAITPHTVRTRLLREICYLYVQDRTIDFLKIDAEGHEQAVLAGADFTRWRPRVVLVETTDFSTWDQLILDGGYTFTLFDGLNRYYVRNEEPELMSRLSVPANCLDNYIPHEYADRIKELEHELAQVRALVAPPSVPAEPSPIAPVAIAEPPPPRTIVIEPAREADVQAFYLHGCQPVRWHKRPVVALRRLLRRIQRPFFYSLQSSLENVHRELASLRNSANAITKEAETAVNDQYLVPLGTSIALDDLEWAARATAANQAPSNRPLRILFAVSSGSQMYSGIGRAIFELVKQTRGEIEYEFAIDDDLKRNVDILGRFCRENAIPLHVGQADNGSLDPGNKSLAELIRRGNWDALECVSFANAATHSTILKCANNIPIIYTPHYQPMWTIPSGVELSNKIDHVHRELLRHAAVVACDSPWEWLMLRAAAGPGVDCALLPLGFAPSDFIPGQRNRGQYLLFVGDLVEKRKRFPLTLDVFAEVLRHRPDIQLIVVGNKSDNIKSEIPASVRKQCVLRGYVSEDELRRLYREAAGLMQLSDFEAFGLPILEALACGTPVFLSRRPTVAGLFGKYRGAVFIDDGSPARMAEEIVTVVNKGSHFIDQVLADRPRLEDDLSWSKLAAKRCLALRAAIARRGVARKSAAA